MDASKLRNSCICGNTVPYLQCCGIFAEPLVESSTSENNTQILYAFRHAQHELSMALFPLRAIYQAYWEKLNKDVFPHEILMEDADYGRVIIENFFWDYFVQYSDARPILRTAREIEGKELRLAHDWMLWSYAPLWFYRVVERNNKTAKLINIGSQKMHTVQHSGRIPAPGCGVLTRILPFRGREYHGHSMLIFEPGSAATTMDSLFRAGCRELKIKPSVTIRPDVHCDEWRAHGAEFLALWRNEHYDSQVGRPVRGSGSAPILNLTIRNREKMVSVLATKKSDINLIGTGVWELKYRCMKLARLENRGGNMLVTLTDAAFLAYVKNWIMDHLGESATVSETARKDLPGDNVESQEIWIHTALDVLNSQTPIQASNHDWGRKRLQVILKQMVQQGIDVTGLRRQLGL